jgi:hypothetical protein
VQRQPDAAQQVLDHLPKGCVFDGAPIVLDDAGRPLFDELPLGRRRPTYVAFDLLIADGVDLRSLPLRHRKATLARLGDERRIALANGVLDEGRALYGRQRVTDAYHPKQRRGRADGFASVPRTLFRTLAKATAIRARLTRLCKKRQPTTPSSPPPMTLAATR